MGALAFDARFWESIRLEAKQNRNGARERTPGAKEESSGGVPRTKRYLLPRARFGVASFNVLSTFQGLWISNPDSIPAVLTRSGYMLAGHDHDP